MTKKYNKSIQLRCVVCGSDSDFEFNEDKTYVKCNKCNREYLSGYDELVELNKGLIEEGVEQTKREVAQDIREEINKMFRDAFKGNNHIKLL